MTALRLRELERVESRVVGALRCVDAATRVPIDTPLLVQAPGARLRRNRSGLYVLAHVPALAAHEAAFEAPPGEPALGSVALELTVHDPSERWLPRRARIALPRDPAPARAAQADSLFRPIELALYPGAAAPTGANWAVLRVSVSDSGSGDALGGALLLVTASGRTLARGLSDWRGEALVAVPGVPVTTWSAEPGAVVVSEIAAQIEAVHDPAAGVRTPAAQVRAGRAPARLALVDPDDLEARRESLPRAAQALTLAAVRTQSLSLPLALP